MKFSKISFGYVKQVFEGEKCIRQDFCCTDGNEYWDENDDPIEDGIEPKGYFPYEMEQPGNFEKTQDLLVALRQILPLAIAHHKNSSEGALTIVLAKAAIEKAS
jgi:hypothetical protein